ncbi:hypothetical protein BC834DRAFT_622590 [Gloeopeniophorella convolvens]|nr:hypothetical protein BC834DRAFT_622590 [Gloeopeniophorella convolvens]
MPTLPQGRILVLAFSLVLSCVVFGVSMSLFNAPEPKSLPELENEVDMYIKSKTNWSPGQPIARDIPYYSYHSVGFRVVPTLGAVAALLDFLLVIPLCVAQLSSGSLLLERVHSCAHRTPCRLIASSIKRKTLFSAVVIEAPCIYAVSFFWLATGAYAEHSIETGTNCFPIPSPGPYCAEHKVLEGLAFINWIQLMLYSNTILTVATICHVRKRPVWLQSVYELPTFAAPALRFSAGQNMSFDSPFATKMHEAVAPTVTVSSPSIDSRNAHPAQGTLSFPAHPPPRPAVPSIPASPSLVPLVSPLADAQPLPDPVTPPSPSAPTRPDSPDDNTRPDSSPRIQPTGQPPTYRGPDEHSDPSHAV